MSSLLAAREPVPVETIRSWFAEYRDVSDDAFERKFERDKKEILDLGLALSYVPAGDGLEAGYKIERDRTFLSPIGFDAVEMAVVTIAGTGVLSQSEFPYHRDLERALDKIALVATPAGVAASRMAARRVLFNHPMQQSGPDVRSHLERVSAAVEAGKRLRMVYHTLYSGKVRERTVDPYGLRCWRGRWAVIGHCHERDEVRLFSLHRIRQLDVNEEQPVERDFEVPGDFSVADWQMQPAWRYRMHEPIAVRVEVDPERAWMFEQQLGAPAGGAPDDWAAFEVEVTNADGFVEWALRQGPSLRVSAPDSLVARVADALRAIIARHGATLR